MSSVKKKDEKIHAFDILLHEKMALFLSSSDLVNWKLNFISIYSVYAIPKQTLLLLNILLSKYLSPSSC